MNTISIIIPTLNEAQLIEKLLRDLKEFAPETELIVADGHSSDRTFEIASPLARTVLSPRGRGAQMNAGARRTTGQVLWFLHADCRPHPDSLTAIQAVMADESIVGGGFQYNLDSPGIHYRLAERMSNLKNRMLKLLYGDMGIFVRADVFWEMDGFKEVPLMEDMDFSRRLKRMGKTTILPLTMRTSARRWRREGWLKNIVRNWLLQIAWTAGVSPNILAKWYRFK